jgi:VanZ family protein
MSLIRSNLISWTPPVLWAVLIFLLSSISFEPAPEEQPGFLERYHLDKSVHILLFGALTGLLLRTLRSSTALRLPTAVLLAILITSAYGASDEWHQSFVPGRDASVADWFADSCGAIIAAVAYCRYESRTSTKTNR